MGITSKVNAFRNAVNGDDSCLFVYGIAGECTLEKNQNNRLLMINLTRKTLSLNLTYPKICLVNILYPIDCAWNEPLGFASERGLDFESKIISEIKCEIIKMI